MLITDNYLEQNKNLHGEGNFGVSGYKWATTVEWITQHHKIQHILDYGAGQQTLKKALLQKLSVVVECYDPAIPELSNCPAQAELVTCTDVLEHIEPDNIDTVLDHIQSVASRFVFLVIPTGPAAKTLSDGRNAHLIQQPVHWWLPKLIKRFDLISLNNVSSDIVFFASTKGQHSSAIQEKLYDLIKAPSMLRLQSVSFDGVYWRVAYKSKKPWERVLPRLISIFQLGKKTGVSERCRHPSVVPRIEITKF